MRRLLGALCVGLAGLGGPAAFATVGGPTVCDVLGWDAGTKRVYVHVQPRNEGDVFGTVGYFALGSADPRVLVPVSWNRTGESTAHDPGLQQRLRALRAGLRPLARLTATAMPWRSEVVARDTVAEFGVPRYHVRLSFDREGDYEAVTIHSPVVERIALLAIPGRPERLALFSYTVDPSAGSGYEMQEPVLVLAGESGARPIGGSTVAR